MLLQTNSYIVPKERRAEHARLLRRFRQALARLGCDNFEVYEQVGANWSSDASSGRFVQIMRFRDRQHQLAVQSNERSDPAAQALIAEFCELINFPYQQQQGLFAAGFYSSVLAGAPMRRSPAVAEPEPELADESEVEMARAAAAAEAAAEIAPPDQQTYTPEPAPKTLEHAGADQPAGLDEAPRQDASEIDDDDLHPVDLHPVELPAADPDEELAELPGQFAELPPANDSIPETLASNREPHASATETQEGADFDPDLEAFAHEPAQASGPAADQHFAGNGSPVANGGESGAAAHDLDLPDHLDMADLAHASAAPTNGHPAAAIPSNGTPGEPGGFDDLLAETFGEEPGERGTPGTRKSEEPVHTGGLSGIGDVLDAGLLDEDDDLDIPLPAELIDEPEEGSDDLSLPGSHPLHGGHHDDRSEPRRG